MKDQYGLSQASIPSAYFQLLLDVVQERGIDVSELKRQSRIPAHISFKEDTRLSTRQWTRLIMGAIELAGDEGLGLAYGLQTTITTHGVMGFALLSCPTIADVQHLVTRFFNMRVRGYLMEVGQQQGRIILSLKELHPAVGLDADRALLLRRFLHEAVLLAAVQILRYLTGSATDDIVLGVPWPKPDYYPAYQQACPQLPVFRFEQDSSYLSFSVAWLDYPIATGNRIAYEFALQQCEREDVSFPAVNMQRGNVVLRVKEQLLCTPGQGYPALSAIASVLGMSERSLKRYLEVEGTSFALLLNAQKQQDASSLLQDTALTVQQISERLGYASSINFARAFRQWFGMTPSQYRQGHGSNPI